MQVLHERGFCDAATCHKDWIGYAELLTSGVEPLEEFERVFSKDGEPDEVQEFTIATVDGKVFLPKLLVDCGLAKSNGEAMRLIAQGGVHLDGTKAAPGTRDVEAAVGKTVLVKVGRRHFAKVTFRAASRPA